MRNELLVPRSIQKQTLACIMLVLHLSVVPSHILSIPPTNSLHTGGQVAGHGAMRTGRAVLGLDACTHGLVHMAELCWPGRVSMWQVLCLQELDRRHWPDLLKELKQWGHYEVMAPLMDTVDIGECHKVPSCVDSLICSACTLLM